MKNTFIIICAILGALVGLIATGCKEAEEIQNLDPPEWPEIELSRWTSVYLIILPDGTRCAVLKGDDSTGRGGIDCDWGNKCN